MLQRLFSRGVSRDRIEDAIEHSSEAEQRDVLRDRSAAILERLERRKLEARRAELDRMRAEREAAEQRALADTVSDSQTDADVEAGPEAMVATAETTAPVEADDSTAPELPEAEERAEAAETAYSDDGTGAANFAGAADAFAEPAAAEEVAQTISDEYVSPATEEAEPDVAPQAQETAVEFMPLSEPSDDQTEPESEVAAEIPEPVIEDVAAPVPHPDFDEQPAEAMESVAEVADGDAPAGGNTADGLFADSAPLRAVADSDPAQAMTPVDHGECEDAAGDNPGSSLTEEDPQAYEQLRRKADEAKARIAKRLETLKAEEEAKAAAGMLDLGAVAPPLAPEHD